MQIGGKASTAVGHAPVASPDMQFRRQSACKSGERRPQPLATRLPQVPHSLIDDRGDANRGEAQDTFKRVVHGLGREPFHRTDVEAAQVLMRETISADERHSEAIRRNQTQSDSIRRNQTQSDPIRPHQMQSRTCSKYSCIESNQMHSDALRCTQIEKDALTHLLEVLLHRVERGRVPWAGTTHERQLLE